MADVAPIRFTTEGAEKVERDFVRVGGGAQKMGRDIKRGGEDASRGLLLVDNASQAARGAVEGLADGVGRLPGPLGEVAGAASRAVRGLSGMAPAATAGAAAVVALVAATGAGVRFATEFEQNMLRVEGVLHATGNAAGLTAREIELFSQSLARDTMASTEGVQEAAAALLSFRKVSGDTFTRTLSLAQDMAAVLGGSLTEHTRRLGRALDDPVKGLESLSEMGIRFTNQQKEVIKSFIESGQRAKALDMILAELEGRFEGAGKKEAEGIAGYLDTLAENTKVLLAAWANSSGAAGVFEGALKRVAAASTNAVERLDPANNADAIRARIAAREAALAPKQIGQDAQGNPIYDRNQRGAVEYNGAKFGRRYLENENARDRERLAIAEKQTAEQKKQTEAARQQGEWQQTLLEAEERITAWREKSKKAGEDAARAAEAEAKAQAQREARLADIIEMAEAEARFAMLTREDREIQLALMNAQKAAARDLTEEEEARLRTAIEYRQEIERLADRAKDAKASVDKSGAELERVLEQQRRDQEREGKETFRNLSDFYYDVFSNKSKSVWSIFKELGLRAIAETFAAATLGQGTSLTGLFSGGGGGLGGILGGLFGGGQAASGDVAAGSPGFAGGIFDLGGLFGSGGAAGAGVLGSLGAAIPHVALAAGSVAAISGISKMLGLSKKGSLIGGGVGALAALAGGAALAPVLAGALLGGVIGALTKKKPRSQVDLSGAGYGDVFVRGKASAATALDMGDAVLRTVKDFARQLGLGYNPNVDLGVLGQRGKEFFYDPRSGLKDKQYGDPKQYRYQDAEDAVAAAIKDALMKGVVTGLSEASKSILRSTRDINAALQEVAELETAARSIDKGLMAFKDPLRAELTALVEVQNRRAELAVKAGVEIAKIEELNALERQQALDKVLGQAKDSINDVLNSITGAANPYISATERYTRALSEFETVAAKAQAGDLDALNAVADAAAAFIEASRGINASSSAFFRDQDRVQGVLSGLLPFNLPDDLPQATIPQAQPAGNNVGSLTPILQNIGVISAEGFAGVIAAINNLKTVAQTQATTAQAQLTAAQQALAQRWIAGLGGMTLVGAFN